MKRFFLPDSRPFFAKKTTRKPHRLLVETLEPRQMLAASPIISEFMADNNNTIDDGDGSSSDWIEIYNAGDEAVNLVGYHLTDQADLLEKWTFPSVPLGPGEYLVVFASAPLDDQGALINNYVDGGGNLHTNFKLSSGGEFLALIEPDGTTIASSFTPNFPKQFEDVSFGIQQDVAFTTLIQAGSAGRLLIPSEADDQAIADTWQGGQVFDDSTWQAVTVGIGFDEVPPPVLEFQNVALGKPTIQSTNGFGFTGAQTVDGNLGTFSHTATGDLTPWVEVDLQEEVLIESIDVTTRSGCCSASGERDYNLTVEIFNANGQVVYTDPEFNPWDGGGGGAFDIGEGASFTVDLTGEIGGGIDGQFVRVTKDGFAGSEWLHLGEIEIFAEGTVEVGPENLALNKPTDGDEAFGRPPSNGVDGIVGVFTHSDNVGPVFWEVDFEEPTNLGSFEIVNRADGCCAERLNGAVVSVLDELGEPIFVSDPIENAGVGQIIVFDNELAGFRDVQFIRIDHEDQYLTIAELRAFAPEGYQVFIDTDIEAEMKGVNASAYLRLPFTVDDEETFDNLTLSMNYDDGFVAYLNGTEIARRNAPAGTPDYNAAATAEGFGGLGEDFNLSTALLQDGENVLTIHGLNRSVDDPDFLILPKLVARSAPVGDIGYLSDPTPGTPNGLVVEGFVKDTSFDIDRGFFTESFDVTIASQTLGATIIYTTDGSAPTLENGTQISAADAETPGSATVHITTTTTLRAAAFKTDLGSTNVDTQSYIFLNDVLGQPSNPVGFPSVWDGVGQNPIAADYELDPEVVNDPAYSDEIIDGLKAIPTMSIVMDPADLFGKENGIYINSGQRGRSWERPTSVEIIEPDGTTFQVDSGIRIHGFSWRFHSNTPKHSFRLEFRDEYGPTKLEYPLFPDAPVDKFDSIVLRAQGGRSWGGTQAPGQSQYLRDTFARDLAVQMGAVDGHATLVHLYLNGLYWGLYNPVERPDSQFGEEYFGGSDEDYDALNRRTSTIEVIDGDQVRYNEMIAIANSALAAGFTTDAQYADLQSYVAEDDFIDFMIRNQYVTNRDGLSAFDGNNQRAIGSRVGEDAQFRFFVWDMEFSMWNATDNNNIGPGLNSPPLAGSQAPQAHAWTVYNALRQHPEFLLRYADHVQQNFFNDGALTPENAAATWEVRAESIEQAIIGESARWGDAKRSTPYTRDVEWQNERDRLLTQYFPQRTGILLEQYKDVGLFPSVSAPEYRIDGQPQHGGITLAGETLSIFSPESISFTDTSLVDRDNFASAYVPFDDDLGDDWWLASYAEGDQGEFWEEGFNGVGYENGNGYQDAIDIDVGLDMSGVGGNTSVYVRLPFTIGDQQTIDTFAKLELALLVDDGYVAYLNGVKIASSNSPTDDVLDWDSASLGAGAEANLNSPVRVDVSNFIDQLVVGQNMLAIHGLNHSTGSSDMLILAELAGQTEVIDPAPTTIYYTTDGSDPRLTGGAVNPGATLFGGSFPLTESTRLRARSLDGGAWSAVSDALFTVETPLRITELMYNPASQTPVELAAGGDIVYGNDQFEFIELLNTGGTTLDLENVALTQGVRFTFAAEMLAPGDSIIVARNTSAFANRYGGGHLVATGQYGDANNPANDSKLDNGGEMIVLSDAAGGVIQSFTYDDDWYKETDGDGFSLVVLDTGGDYDAADNWRGSALSGGSPGAEDVTPLTGDFNGDGIVDALDFRLLAGNYGRVGNGHRGRGDINGDRNINLVDLMGLQSQMGETIGGSPAASPAFFDASISSEIIGSEIITVVPRIESQRLGKSTAVWSDAQLVDALFDDDDENRQDTEGDESNNTVPSEATHARSRRALRRFARRETFSRDVLEIDQRGWFLR